MKKIKLFLLSITLMGLYSSCSLMIMSKKQDIKFNTNNDEAELYVSETKEGEGSEVDIEMKKKGFKQITVRVPEHKDFHKVIVPTKMNPEFWIGFPLDLMFTPLHWGLAWSPSDKKFNYNDEYTLVNDYLIPTKTDNQKYIKYNATAIDLDSKDDFKFYSLEKIKKYDYDLNEGIRKARAESLMDEGSEKDKTKVKEKLNGDNSNLTSADSYFSKDVIDILVEGGYSDTTGNILVNNDNYTNLSGKINKLEFFIGYSFRGIGESLIKANSEITWKITNPFGQLIDSINTSCYSDEFTISYSYYRIDDKKIQNVVSDAIQNSLLLLLQDNRFLEYLNKDNSIFKVKEFDPLSINKPKNIVNNPKQSLKAAVTVKLANNKGHGSGFAISNDGYVLTNYHVVAGDKVGDYEDFKLVMPSGEEVEGEVVRVDPVHDLALIKTENTFEFAFELKDSKDFELLDEVYALGTPASIDLGNTLTLGILSNERKTDHIDKLQLSISINSGNSGGPVFGKNGDLHGVVSSKLVGSTAEGIAFAVPSYKVQSYMNLIYK